MYTYIPSFFIFFQPQSTEFSVLHSGFSSVIYFIHSINSVCISIPISQLVLPPSPWCPYIHLCLYFCFENVENSMGGSLHWKQNYHISLTTLILCSEIPDDTSLMPVTGFANWIQFSSVAQLCLTLCNPMDCNTPGFPVHHQLPELTQTHVCWLGDAVQLSHP